jgi:hypothetical protein
MAIKRTLLCLALVLMAAAGIFAQEKVSNVRDNWLSAELGFIGYGLRYEHMIGPHWSLGTNIYAAGFVLGGFLQDYEAGASLRFYPWGKNFFVGLGAGLHWHIGVMFFSMDSFEFMYNNVFGAAISPEIGWKIDVGKPGGFFLQPGMKLPVTLGKREYYNTSVEDGGSDELAGKFGVGVGFVMYLGLGWAF